MVQRDEITQNLLFIKVNLSPLPLMIEKLKTVGVQVSTPMGIYMNYIIDLKSIRDDCGGKIRKEVTVVVEKILGQRN